MGSLNYTGSKIEGESAQTAKISFNNNLQMNKITPGYNQSIMKTPNDVVDLSVFLDPPPTNQAQNQMQDPQPTVENIQVNNLDMFR